MFYNKNSISIRRTWVAVIVLALCSCTWSDPEKIDMKRQPYYQKIRHWQKQIKTDGWSAAMVDKIVAQSRRMTRYEMEFEDEWLTPKAFMRSGLQGDCEDIAFFIMGTLKELGYPHPVRILVISDLFSDHALLKVELPNGKWKMYDSTTGRTYYRLRKKWTPVVEFDEFTIIYHAPGRQARRTSHP